MKLSTDGIAAIFTLGLLTAPLLVTAQQSENVRRIGVLNFTSAAKASTFFKVSREELRQYGWVEGQNLTIVYRYAEGKVELLPELAREVMPALARVAVIWEPTNPGVQLNFQQTQRGAQQLGLMQQSLEVQSRHDFASAFAAVTRERPDALIPSTAPLTVQHAALIAELRCTIACRRSPAGVVFHWRVGLCPFESIINLKTAEALGLPIPSTLPLRADKVIK